jgi:hypothetical protein
MAARLPIAGHRCQAFFLPSVGTGVIAAKCGLFLPCSSFPHAWEMIEIFQIRA